MIEEITGEKMPMCRKTLMQQIEEGFQRMKEAVTETLKQFEPLKQYTRRQKHSNSIHDGRNMDDFIGITCMRI